MTRGIATAEPTVFRFISSRSVPVWPESEVSQTILPARRILPQYCPNGVVSPVLSVSGLISWDFHKRLCRWNYLRFL